MLLIFIKVINRIFDVIFTFTRLIGIELPKNKLWYYQGVCFSESMHKGKVEQIPDFEVDDSDVFISTYPRSGTHFATEIIDALLDGGDTTRLLNVHTVFRSPMIEFGPPYAAAPALKLLLSIFGITQRHSKDISGYYKSRKPPRVFKTHLPIKLMPKQLMAGKGKMVYIARNPLDTMVSMWKLASKMSLNPYRSFDEFYGVFLSGDIVFGSWFDHVVGYWKEKDKKNILFLKYEDMKKDIRGTIRQLTEFLGRDPISDEAVERIVNHCSIESMKANEMASPDSLFPNAALAKRKEGGFIRKGAVGDWSNQITEEQAEKIKNEYQKKVASHDLILDFKHDSN